MTTTARQVAKAINVGPRSKGYVLRDENGLAYEGNRCSHVLSALGRSDITPDLSFKVHTVAFALNKSISSARMDPTSSLRIQAYTAYQLCALVARIANECPETTIGGICDGWIHANHASL
jgi:hypothetical protein